MSPGYIELHCHSNFSLLDGASHPEALVAQAAALGMPALALTDHDAVYGAVRFIQAAQAQGIRPILGAELTLAAVAEQAGVHHLTLLVENEAGWHNLCYLISRARHNAPKGTAVLPPEELVGCTDGLIALSGCRRGEIPTALQRNDRESALAAARRYRGLFGSDRFFIELQNHHLPGDERLVKQLFALSSYLKLGCVASNNVHYAAPSGYRLQEVLTCIRHRTTLETTPYHLRRLNSEYYLKSPAQMARLFADYPEALANSRIVADRCRFDLRYGLQDLPRFATPGGMSGSAYLRRLSEEGLRRRYPELPDAVRAQLDHELAVIERAGLANYFLIVWDITRFARENGIRCQGRGSAAGSLVAYLLGISPIDPLAHGLVFERFLSDERQVVPDIDLDFAAARREEVIAYLYQRYGADHTAMACTYVTFQRRSALRDVGKALGLSPEVMAAAVETLERDRLPDNLANDGRFADGRFAVNLLLDLCNQIDGFPRHLGIHAGGMVLTGAPLMGRLPTEPAAMPGRVVTQWDKEALADVGLVKLDVLGLRMLSAIGDSLDLIEATTGQRPDLEKLDFRDAAVYEMIAAADTIGVFQVESRAQAQMLPKLRPRCFADLIVAISLIRPGPIQGNMVQPYLRRRLGLEPVNYAHPLLEAALAETLGVILFQEQVLKVARDLAGFTAGQGERLRRALDSKRAGEELEGFRAAFLAGAEAKGVPPETAELVFAQLRGFGSYSFAKSHAAAFAVLVYQSAWLKRYHLVPFYTALLNNQPMGFWTAAVLVNEARRQGVELLPVDVIQSQAACTIEAGRIRLGLSYVKGLRQTHIAAIIAERAQAPFADLADFCRRTGLGQRVTESLILAGALDGWGVARRPLLWQLGQVALAQDDTLDLEFPPDEVALPALTAGEAMLGEQVVLGLSAGEQVMSLYRPWLNEQSILGSQALTGCANGQRVRVAGLLVVHQSPPTAKGFHFLTLEDEDGLMNVIVAPGVYGRYRQVIRGARLLVVGGTVQQEDGVTNLLAVHLTHLADEVLKADAA